LLPEADLPLRLVDGGAYFDFLGPQDEPWLRVLLAEVGRFEGRRRRELTERLAEPLPCETPYFKRRAATRVLLRLWRREKVAAVSPPVARARLFRAAAASAAPRATLVAETAAALGVDGTALVESLFADLPGEHVVRAPAPAPTAGELVLRTNLAIVQAALMRASTLELSVEGGVRPIVRLAKLRGLLCTIVEPVDGGPAHHHGPRGFAAPSPTLQISGPFSLFQHTLLYGRALAELLPHLAWCARFELRAACALRGRIVDVAIDSGAPIFPAGAPAPFDSRLEERFARDFSRLAPDWDLVREPEAVRAGTTLIFPDFLVRHRIHGERRVLVELAGFWTPDYLAAKLARLREAVLPPFILCVDDDRACGLGDVPAGLTVVRFRRRVDAAAVLRRVEELTGDEAGAAS
jgi:predicted nuclease of restriction endonuclease-like RecB superfamily